MKRLNSRRRAAVWMVLLVALGAAACTDGIGTETIAHHAPTITTDQSSYTPAQSIIASWTETPGNQDDWIAIVTAGSPPNSGFVALTYTNGQANGNFTFNPLSPGNYEARSYVAGTYQILASTSFMVTGGPPPPPTATVTTDATSYRRSSPITVSWQGTPGNQDDWIALVTAGSPPNSGFVDLVYTNGQQSGSNVFSGIATAGDYEARAYESGTYNILGSTSFSVTSISSDAPTYTVNAPITLSWVAMPGDPSDYVTINTAGSPPNSGFVALQFTNGVRTGSYTFTAGLPAGNYEARSYLGGTYTILDSTPITVAGMGPPPSSFTTDQMTYSPNQTITVSWVSQPGRSQDWLAIVPAGSPANSGFLRFAFVNSQVTGSQAFMGLPEGNYEARYYDEGTYNIRASALFDVGGVTCGSTGPTPVVGSIVSGDLVIDAMQQENTVALTAPLASSILFTSVSEREPSPNYGGVMCTLHDPDMTAGTPAGITCIRNAPGTDTGAGQITVHYTVVTFTSGVTVQRGVANTGFTNPSTITLSAVTPSQSFVLLNGIAVGGSGWGNNEFVRAALVDATTLDVRTAVAGTRVSWQVVDMSGAQVQRGGLTLGSMQTQSAAMISAVPPGTFVLASYTTDNQSGIAAGALSVATSLPDSTSVLFERQIGGAAIDISYEAVSLPFAVHAGTTTFAAGETSRTEMLTGGVQASESVGVCGSQSILGQSTGSTSYAGTDVDLVGEAAATLVTGADSVTVQRASSSAAATFPWFVIDFGHDCNGN